MNGQSSIQFPTFDTFHPPGPNPGLLNNRVNPPSSSPGLAPPLGYGMNLHQGMNGNGVYHPDDHPPQHLHQQHQQQQGVKGNLNLDERGMGGLGFGLNLNRDQGSYLSSYDAPVHGHGHGQAQGQSQGQTQGFPNHGGYAQHNHTQGQGQHELERSMGSMNLGMSREQGGRYMGLSPTNPQFSQPVGSHGQQQQQQQQQQQHAGHPQTSPLPVHPHPHAHHANSRNESTSPGPTGPNAQTGGIGAWMDGVNAAGGKNWYDQERQNGSPHPHPQQQSQLQQQQQQGQQAQSQQQQQVPRIGSGQGQQQRNGRFDLRGSGSGPSGEPGSQGQGINSQRDGSGQGQGQGQGGATSFVDHSGSGPGNKGNDQAQGWGRFEGRGGSGRDSGMGQNQGQRNGMDPQDGQNSGSGTPVNAPASTQQQQQQMNGDQDLVNAQSTERMIGKLVDDEVIPTAIVIKNIPFAVQKETLLAIIESLQAPLPYAFNYHHDNGVFRGLAFANFRHPHEADAVVVALNGYDISGRKLRVEYKKVLQAGEKERIEREKAIKRMKSMQFDRGQLQQGQQPSNAGSRTGFGQNRQASWAQSGGNHGGNQSHGNRNDSSNGVNGIPPNLLTNMSPQQLQNVSSGLPSGSQQFGFSQLTPPLTTQSTSSGSTGMVSNLSHLYLPQHVSGALIRERTESTNTTGSQNVQRDDRKNGHDSAMGSGNMQAMQQQHLQQLHPNPDRLPSPALSLGAGSSTGGGALSPSLAGGFPQSQPMQITASNPGSQTGYNDVDFNDPVVLDIFSRALMFKEDRMRDEFSFSRNLSVKDRRAVHAVGEKLGLHHYSMGEGMDRYVVLSKVDPSRNNPSRVLSRQTGRVQSMAGVQSGSYLSPYSPPLENESRPESPGLRIKKSMPNMSLLNGPTVSRDPHRLLNKRSSGNLRDYANMSGGQQSRRPFASHTGATGSSSFNNLFGNALGNGTFENASASSPTSPSDPTLATQGSNLPGLPGGFVRQPLGPTSETKGFSQRTQLRTQTAPSSGSKGMNGVIGGQRTSSSNGKGDSHSIHTSGSSTIEEEETEINKHASDHSSVKA